LVLRETGRAPTKVINRVARRGAAAHEWLKGGTSMTSVASSGAKFAEIP
jgi:hypothetical protein